LKLEQERVMSEFGWLLTLEIPALRRFARGLTRNTAEADDLVQNCLMRALLKEQLWQPGTNLRRWLFTMLYNQRMSLLRREALQREKQSEAWQALAPSAAADPVSRLLVDEMVRAIAALPAGQREAMQHVALGEMDYPEAAKRLAVPMGTLRSRLARARVVLRKRVDETADAGGVAPFCRAAANAAEHGRRLAA
jgi:RNA polymerase sigma-70 factor, ECF subfamily